MNGVAMVSFPDQWLWLVFILVGLLLAILELFGGIETELDLVFIGSALIFGGLIGWPFSTWSPVVVASGVVSIVYIAVGRRYIKRWVQVRQTKTNVDAIIGNRGLVLKSISRFSPGRIRVGAREWRASAEEDIAEGTEVVVTAVRGATLIVNKNGGDEQ